MLSLYAVDKSFGRSKILKSIDLQLDKKTYGLLGPNGAGKTTLMRCITGLYPLSAGKIEFNGSDISKDKNFQSHIGYLPQKFGLYKELTAFEMMEMLADLKGISREKIGDEAKKYIKLVGLQDKLDKKVKTLSGGMIRRLGVAQLCSASRISLSSTSRQLGSTRKSACASRILFQSSRASAR